MSTIAEGARTGGARFIAWAIGGFFAACVLLLALGRFMKPEVEPGFAVSPAKPTPAGVFRVTLDVQDNKRWVAFSFGAGQVGQGDADLWVQRHRLRAPAGAIDLGAVDLARAQVPAEAGWVRDELHQGVEENPALARWYNYSYWTHLLKTKGHTYAVRRAGGGVAYFRVLSYYCEPEGTGCLTLEYRLDG
jgi:hypothetical protein